MKILSFANFAKSRPALDPTDWTQQEIADFYRAHRLLRENGAGIGLDRGLSDAGEPWMAFYDLATQDVFMHVARIEARCILVCDPLAIRLEAADIPRLIVDFENAVRRHLTVRTGNVVIHPAARIIMSISMVFLLFKLDSSPAHARGTSEAKSHQAPEPAATRASHANSDFGLIGRAQSAFARMLENADAPASVAVLAGIILAGELAAKTPAEATHAEAAAAAPIVTALPVVSLLATAQTAETKPEAVRHVEARPETVAAAPQNHTAPATPNEPALAAGKLVVAGENADKTAPALIAKLLAPEPETVEATARAATPSEQQTTLAPAAAAASASDNNQAVQTFTALFGWNPGQTKLDRSAPVDTVAATGKTAAPTEKAVVSGPAAAVNKITDISVATLDSIDDHAGFFLRTTLSNVRLFDALTYFITKLEQHYEVEYIGGKVLIEQTGMTGTADHDIGLWTNVMNDGSSISVVGQASIVDDISAFLV